ncbi:hypothetical protein DL98DRAFT_287976 [Cadophora sp. DSE1049]|nr:hypothetical protein DL98DRAFT_287976 [Cadophora sp. DSE1049]
MLLLPTIHLSIHRCHQHHYHINTTNLHPPIHRFQPIPISSKPPASHPSTLELHTTNASIEPSFKSRKTPELPIPSQPIPFHSIPSIYRIAKSQKRTKCSHL